LNAGNAGKPDFRLLSSGPNGSSERHVGSGNRRKRNRKKGKHLRRADLMMDLRRTNLTRTNLTQTDLTRSQGRMDLEPNHRYSR
jgi:hypothetical protein